MRLLPRVGWCGHLGIPARPEGTSSCWWEHVAFSMGDTEPGPPHITLPRLLRTPWLPAWRRGRNPPRVGSTAQLEGGAQPTWKGSTAQLEGGAQSAWRGEHSPAGRGAQPSWRGSTAQLEEGAQSAWRGRHSPAGRGAQPSWRGSTAQLKGGAQPSWRGEHGLDSLLICPSEDHSMGLPGGAWTAESSRSPGPRGLVTHMFTH